MTVHQSRITTQEPYLLREARKLIQLTKEGHFFYHTVEQTCNWIEENYLNQLVKDLKL